METIELKLLSKESLRDFKVQQGLCVTEELIATGWDVEKARKQAEWCCKAAQIQREINVDGEPVGWIEWSGHGRILYFNYVLILEDMRGKGYGHKAIKAVLEKYKTEASVVQSSCYAVNFSGLKTLQKAGFEAIGQVYQLGN